MSQMGWMSFSVLFGWLGHRRLRPEIDDLAPCPTIPGRYTSKGDGVTIVSWDLSEMPALRDCWMTFRRFHAGRNPWQMWPRDAPMPPEMERFMEDL